MQILVCMKQVPDKDSRYKIDAAGTGIHEEDLVFETNESDQYALEEALRLKEKFGGEVVLLSLGDERVLKSIKNGLAMGADRALHLTGTGVSWQRRARCCDSDSTGNCRSRLRCDFDGSSV